ncbi:MAG: DUF4349 domain-containing protein [Gaiellaceae bacterium]
MSRPDRDNPKDRLEQTARELRKHRPRPSAALVARVERLAERQTERRPRPARPGLSRRRLVLALAAMLAIAIVGGVIAGELGQSSKSVASRTVRQHVALQAGLAPSTVSGSESIKRAISTSSTDQSVEAVPVTAGLSAGSKPSEFQAASGAPAPLEDTMAHASRKSLKKAGSVAPITTGNRLAELRATLLLKVENRDQLSERTAEAMKIARSLSGYVVTTRVNAPSRGIASSYLVLKVPAKRSQEALIRISELGKILSQQVSLVDVKGTVTSEGNAIQALKREIASLEQTLNNQSLTAQARSQLEIQLANDRARLNSLRVQRNQDILRGRLATITLTLTTGDLPKPATNPSRVHKAIDRAWNGLSSEISWAAMAIIVASPFLVIGVALLALLRVRRRREERRLLEK